jgi:hypothetical protein
MQAALKSICTSFPKGDGAMIPSISKISDLPRDIVKKYKMCGWTNEEILEHWGDAVHFLNTRIRCEQLPGELPMDTIFSCGESH